MNKSVLIKITVLLSLILLSAGCVGIPKPIIKDELPPNAAKGYVAFSPQVGGYSVSLVRDNKELEEGRIEYSQEYRIAKTPGEYVFLIKHQKFSGRVKVTVLQDKINYVTIQSQTMFQSSYTTYSTYYRSTTTTRTYNVNLTAGSHYLPVNPTLDQVNELLAALDDDDEGTRLAALDDLAELYKLNEKMNTTVIADTLKKTYNKERYYWARYKIEKFLKKIGQPVDKTDEDSIVWDGFTDKVDPGYTGYSGIDPWFTDNKTNYFFADGYHIDHDNDNSNWAFRTLKKKMPVNVDVELTSTWQQGINNYTYGLLLGSDGKNFYEFGISRNGGARVDLYKNSGLVKNLIPWKQLSGIKNARNVLKLELRGNVITYYVNDELVGAITNEEGFSFRTYGLIVAKKQNISFNLLRIVEK